jgi:hypothetical protein
LKEHVLHPANQRPLIRTLVTEIEALRLKRRAQWQERLHPNGKQFTQEELCDLAYPSYKNLLKGRTLRLPSRVALLGIADYLECALHETNDLLLAAEYMPLQVELRADQERVALEQARHMMHSFPLPTILVTRGWHWEEHNRFFQNIYPSLVLHQLRHRSIFDVILTPMFPFRHAWGPDAPTWRTNIQSFLTLFRDVHRPFRREAWYQQMLTQAQRDYPDIAPLWAPIAATEELQLVYQHRMLDTITGVIFHNRAFPLTFGPAAFPQLIVTMPVDAAARQVYQRAGCELNEDGWLRAAYDFEQNDM